MQLDIDADKSDLFISSCILLQPSFTSAEPIMMGDQRQQEWMSLCQSNVRQLMYEKESEVTSPHPHTQYIKMLMQEFPNNLYTPHINTVQAHNKTTPIHRVFCDAVPLSSHSRDGVSDPGMSAFGKCVFCMANESRAPCLSTSRLHCYESLEGSLWSLTVVCVQFDSNHHGSIKMDIHIPPITENNGSSVQLEERRTGRCV